MTQRELVKKLDQLKKAAAATDRKTAKLNREVEQQKQTNARLLEDMAELERRLAKAS
jgi:hypothetical protein